MDIYCYIRNEEGDIYCFRNEKEPVKTRLEGGDRITDKRCQYCGAWRTSVNFLMSHALDGSLGWEEAEARKRTITLSKHEAQAEEARHHVEALLSLHTTQDFIHGDDKTRTVLTEALAWLNDTKEEK